METYKVLTTISQDETERRLYEAREMQIHDEVSRLEDAREQGIEQGIEQGLISARREDILENLRENAVVNDEIIKMINELSDVDILKRWLRISARVNSLEEFKNKVNTK